MKSISIILLALAATLATADVVDNLKGCLNQPSISEKVKCAAAVLEPEVAKGLEQLEEELKNAPKQIQDFLTKTSQQIHDAIESRTEDGGFFDQAHKKGHELKNQASTWWNSLWNSRRKRDISDVTDALKAFLACIKETKKVRECTSAFNAQLGDDSETRVKRSIFDPIVGFWNCKNKVDR